MTQGTGNVGKRFGFAISILLCLTILMLGCLDPYTPPTTNVDTDILVVDGFLNTTEGTAIVHLTSTRPLSNSDAVVQVLGAQVTIEDNAGNFHTLLQTDTGSYTLAGIETNSNAQYRLKVRTANAEDYISDFVAVKPTPPIDSITWAMTPAGISIRANTHDATGNTRYYRWDYVETWEYHSSIVSQYKIVDRVPVYRQNEDLIYTCWNTAPSTKIIIASTDRLSQDLVSQFPINAIAYRNPRLMTQYSALVRQRAISREEYNFLEQLQKSTESIGGLFDPQPGQVIGNMHNVNNSATLALGYFGAGNTTSSRFFLDADKIPYENRARPLDQGCLYMDTLCVNPGAFRGCTLLVSQLGGGETIAAPIYQGNTLVGYTLSTTYCADCRISGGTTTRPVFWP